MALSKVDLANMVENVAPASTIPDVNFRNIIINGDMKQSQRSTSVASITGSGYNTVDRFRTNMSSAGTWTQSQSTTVPSGQGFSTSLKMDCTTADGSLSAGDYLIIDQRVEGQNLQYLKKGTSSAESTTISFWVRSNKTGTYIAALNDTDNSRYIAKSYTISSADTWEKKTLTFAGDTTGAFGNDNGTSLKVQFWLAAGTTYTSGTLATSWESATNANQAVGQVNLADSTSNEWYITGVQLEAGTTASDFEFLPHDIQIERCKRYFQTIGSIANPANGSNQTISMAMARTVSQAQGWTALRPHMRGNPTVSGIGTVSNLKAHTTSGGNVNTSGIVTDGTPSPYQVNLHFNNLTSGLTANQPVRIYGDYTVTFDAEL